MSLLRETWEVAQWEKSDLAEGGGPGEKGGNYVAGECLGCWGAEEAKTEGGKEKEAHHLSAVCLWRHKERQEKKREMTEIPPLPRSHLQSLRTGCEVTAQTTPKGTRRSPTVIGRQPSILTNDT